MQQRPSPLEDSRHASHAWGRFRRILRWMALATSLACAAAVIALDIAYGPLAWTTIAATIGGVGGSVMLAAVLMGLSFLSSGTGHDEVVDNRD